MDVKSGALEGDRLRTDIINQPPGPIEQEIPDLYLSSAITRAVAEKAKQNYGMQDIDLTDTLISRPLMMRFEILSDIQTDFDTSRSNTDLSPSISNDQLPGSQLCKKQDNNPEISPLFESALDENEMSQVTVCYYVKIRF